jgi:hypothetical protein
MRSRSIGHPNIREERTRERTEEKRRDGEVTVEEEEGRKGPLGTILRTLSFQFSCFSVSVGFVSGGDNKGGYV